MKELPTPTLELSPHALPRGLLHPASPALGSLVRGRAPGSMDNGIQVAWARHLDEVREAQRLRHLVFAGEMGARLPDTVPGHDVDLFDDFCEHLLVRDTASGTVIGTYRVLTPAQANSFEALPFFIGAVIIAHQLAAPQALLDVLAAAFIALRVAYIALYVADRAVARSVVWGLALLINMAIFFIGFR